MAFLGRVISKVNIPSTSKLFFPSSRTALTSGLWNKRNFNDNARVRFSSTAAKNKKERVKVHFIDRDGNKLTANAKIGDNLLDVIIENDIDIDGFGACEGTLACSTCHLIFKQPDYDKLPDTPTDEELDMLDLAYGLTDTSRLGCQVIVSKDMEDLEVSVPAAVADARGPV